MRLFVRTLYILAAALVVAGITFALNQGGVIQSEAPTRPNRAEFTQSSTTTAETTAVLPREREGESAGIRGLGDVSKSLVIVGVIVVLFTFVQYLWDKLRGKRDRRHAPHAPKVNAQST